MLYVTLAVALRDMASVQPGDNVLVHMMDGRTTALTAQIAASLGAAVLTTGGNICDRAWLRGLGVKHVMSSCCEAIISNTLQLDTPSVVINSFAESDTNAGCLAALRADGRFVVINDYNMWSKERVAQGTLQFWLPWYHAN